MNENGFILVLTFVAKMSLPKNSCACAYAHKHAYILKHRCM